MSEAAQGLRLDKWLWYARFFKSRSLASKVCDAGKVRVDGTRISKAHHLVRPGAVLTFPQSRHIRVVKVLALGSRRGPASEAKALYEDLKPPEPDNRLPRGADLKPAQVAPDPGAGRPNKKQRRALAKLKEPG